MFSNLIQAAGRNQLLHDMAVEHRKMIHGAFYNAIREITGKEPDQLDMAKHAGIETFDHMGYADYIYKKQTILRVYAPVFTHKNRETRVFQKVEEVWKKNARHRRN